MECLRVMLSAMDRVLEGEGQEYSILKGKRLTFAEKSLMVKL